MNDQKVLNKQKRHVKRKFGTQNWVKLRRDARSQPLCINQISTSFMVHSWSTDINVETADGKIMLMKH